MSGVRPFQESDSSQVADLHRRGFKTGAVLSPRLERAYERYFKTIFLNNPCASPGVSSLVFEEAGGAIVGFLGVTPQPMIFRDKPVLAAVSSQLIVDPVRRSTLAGVQLLKTFLSGPQDLSLADEANETAREIWRGLGGHSAVPQSIQWVKVFRPGDLLLSRLVKSGQAEERRRLGWKAALAAPFCRIGDAVAGALPGNHFSAPPATGTVAEPTVEGQVSCLAELTKRWPLRPAYDSRSLRWRLGIMERHTERGTLRKGIVRNSKDEIVGWYLYYAKRRGLGEVVQLCATANSQEEVLSHLFFDAWENRVAALCGRLEPEFMDGMRKKKCLLYNRGFWMLVHSRNSAILQTIRCGDAFVSRLEGEYPSHFGKAAFHVKEGEQEAWCEDRVNHAPLANTPIGTHP